MPRATSQSENHSCRWIKLPEKPSTKKTKIRFGKACQSEAWGQCEMELPLVEAAVLVQTTEGREQKQGAAAPPQPAWHPAQLCVHRDRTQPTSPWDKDAGKWIQKKIQAPHILVISFHYKTPQLKGSSDLPPGFFSRGFQAWSGSCPTSPSARLRHRHFFKLVVFHSTSTAEFLQHLQLLQGPAKTHLYLFRKRIHWQSSILQSSSQGPGMLCRTLKCSRIAHSHVSPGFSSEWWPK